MESNSPPNQDLEERRRAAARAMEGEEIRQRREAREKLKEIGAAAEASELVEKLKVKELNLSPLRTLKGDMARAVREEGVSVASVALSEQARRQANGSPIAAKSSSARVWFLFLIFLLILGAGGYWWWFGWPAFLPPPATWWPFGQIVAPPAPSGPAGLIFAEESVAVSLDGTVEENLAALHQAAGPTVAAASSTLSLSRPRLRQINFTRGAVPAGWNAISAGLGFSSPPALGRALTGELMFGAIQFGSGSQRFLLLKNRDYAQARASFLAWEPELVGALWSLWRSTVATGAERQAVFVDRLLRNKDLRLAQTTAGETVLLYTFLDPETILIAADEATFSEVFDRYLNVRI